MKNLNKYYLDIHLAVLFYGFTAILGAEISVTALILVWWRVALTTISLTPYTWLHKAQNAFHPIYFKKFAIVGCVVGLHWIAFYGSVKLANASVAVLCMAATSFFTALLEPWIKGRKISSLEISFGIVIMGSIFLVVGGIDQLPFWGVASGIMAALLAALFSVLNEQYINHQDKYIVTWIEMLSAWLLLSILIFIIWISGYFDAMVIVPSSIRDWILLVVLALVCTTWAFTLTLNALNHLSAYTVNLVINLEPVYGIILAAIWLEDYKELNKGFYIGAVFIILLQFLYPWLLKKHTKYQL